MMNYTKTQNIVRIVFKIALEVLRLVLLVLEIFKHFNGFFE